MTVRMNDDELIERLNEGEWWQTVQQGPNPTSFSCDLTNVTRVAASRLTELKKERERLNQLALDGVNMGIATGIELSAEWLVKNIDRLGQHNVKLVAAAMISEVCEGRPPSTQGKQGDE